MPSTDFDRFESHADTLSSPAREAFAITPSDTEALAQLPKAILIGGSGTITLRAIDSDADVVVNVAAGQIIPIRPEFVRVTGTSATHRVGLA